MEEETKAILETIDDSTLDRNDDWSDVVKEIDCLKDKWRKIGCNLRVKPEKIKEIARDHPQDSETCLSEVVLEWLKRNYNSARFGEPSWRMLARAVVELDRDLFKRIAKRHNYNISVMESLATAVNRSTQLICRGSLPTSPRFSSDTSKANSIFLSLPIVTMFLILSTGIMFLWYENQHLKADMSLRLNDSHWLEISNILVKQDIVNKEESIARDTLELKVKDAEKRRLKQALVDKEKQINDLKKELNYFEVQAIFYSQRNEENGIQIARCEQMIAQLNTSKEELKSKLDELIAESKHLKERLSQKEEVIDDLRAHLSLLREMRADINDTLKKKNYQYNLQQEVLADLEQKVKDFRITMQDQQNEIDSLAHDRDTMKTARDELETNWHSERKQRKLMTDKSEELKVKVLEQNSSIRHLLQERDTLKALIDELQTLRQKDRESMKERTDEIIRLTEDKKQASLQNTEANLKSTRPIKPTFNDMLKHDFIVVLKILFLAYVPFVIRLLNNPDCHTNQDLMLYFNMYCESLFTTSLVLTFLLFLYYYCYIIIINTLIILFLVLFLSEPQQTASSSKNLHGHA